MEHYRSTLGTAAAAVFGLVVAARVLHPGNFEDLSRPEHPILVADVADAAAPRVEPPFDLYLRPSTSSSEMAVLAPRMTRLVPGGITMMPTVPSAMATDAGRSLSVETPGQRKVARRVVRARQAAPARARTARAQPTDTRPTRSEPLDVSSRDYDLGREG